MTTTQKIDWSGCPLIKQDPLKLGGAPNIDGIRLTPETIVEHYEGGFSIAEIVEIFPAVNEKQAHTILTYASELGWTTLAPQRPLTTKNPHSNTSQPHRTQS